MICILYRDSLDEKIFFKNREWQVSAKPYQLNFKFPFKLALNTRTFTQIVLLKIKNRDAIFYGEAALPPYLGADADSVFSFFNQLDWGTILMAPLDESLDIIDHSLPGNNAAKAAIDMALHDIESQSQGKSIGEFYNIIPDKPIFSTYTIGISTEAELVTKLEEGKDFKIIKLKLGSEDDKALIKAFKKHSRKSFCVDVNQGYATRDQAALMSDFLLKSGALFIEQPLPSEHLEEMAWVRGRVDIPFIADESIKRLPDLKYAAEAFNGVNIKLMKATGIKEAIDMITLSRKLNLKVVLGAMAESSLGNTAAAHLGMLADWVDLDGPMLTSNDPFKGIKYRDGAIVFPERLGLGAIARPEL